MARKRRKSAGLEPDLQEILENFDPRALEGQLSQLFKGPHDGDDESPLGRAQALVFRAFGEESPRRRLRLARKALDLCPDCADAYVLLAEHADSRKETLALYEQGVAAGERALGPRAFQDMAGQFWGILETRPYMRARRGLAFSLWTAGRRAEAIQHLQDMLRLNPTDNQGLRYTLAGFLLSMDRDEDLRQLLDRFPEECSAAWAYTRALLAFRRAGDTPEVLQLLKAAIKTNKYLPTYLLGEKWPPQGQPPFYQPGDESEAHQYVGNFLASWKATPGAISWLRQHARKSGKQPAQPAGKGPLVFVKHWLKQRLPQEADVWQADVRLLPTWVVVAGRKVRPWMILAVTCNNGLVLAHHLSEEEPTPALLWDKLVDAMQIPLAGEPHRPVEIQVRPHARWQALESHLAEVGIQLVQLSDLDRLEELFQDLSEYAIGKPERSLLAMPGIKPEMVAGFYDAAAAFYRRAPWRQVGYESAIKIACAKYQSGPWYGVLMGQSGFTTGLALYESLKLLRKLWSSDLTDEENARMTVSTTVTFGEATDLAVADVDAAQSCNWPVAGPEAYPAVFHKERGMTTRPPLAWELELMEGCLRALPVFVSRRRQDDPTPETLTVPVASGTLELVLAWVDED